VNAGAYPIPLNWKSNCSKKLAVTECDSPSCQIIWTQLNKDPIPNQNFHKVLPNLATNRREDERLGFRRSIDLTAKHGIGETVHDNRLDLDDIILDLFDTLPFIFSFVSFGPCLFLPEEWRWGGGADSLRVVCDEGEGCRRNWRLLNPDTVAVTWRSGGGSEGCYVTAEDDGQA